MNVRERMVFLQSWWVASELLRRHPDLELIEMHPGDGQYDCLTIVGPKVSDSWRIELNRHGSIHIHPETSPSLNRRVGGRDFPISWQVEQEKSDRRAVPYLLEEALGLSVPVQTPSTTHKTLTFRTIYHLLLFALNENKTWEVRNSAPYAAPAAEAKNTRFFDEITSARASLVHYAKEATQKRTFWGIIRDGHSVALLQENATLHRPNKEPVDFMELFNEHRRDILSSSLAIRQLIQ